MSDNVFIGWKTYIWRSEELYKAYLNKEYVDTSVSINKYNNLITINASYSFKQIFYFPYNNDFSDWYQTFNTVKDAKTFVEDKLALKGYKLLDESYLAYA